MLLAILSTCTAEELEESSEEEEAKEAELAEIEARKNEIRKKILAVGRMQRVFQLLRYEKFSLFLPAFHLRLFRTSTQLGRNQKDLRSWKLPWRRLAWPPCALVMARLLMML